jgi:hypothetical protein
LTLSFLIHSKAIGKIYSPKVNTNYDELEKKNLIDDSSLFSLSKIDAGHFQVEFLSRLRLLMKLDKRRIKNALIEKNNTCWKICETNIFIETQFKFKDRKYENVLTNSERLTYTQYINESLKNY